jgi:membrane protein implicated in regulation of membrane protease activity
VWSARSLDREVIEPGAEVTVVEISGATAVVLSGA